jgi:hypothetical protein
VVADGLNTLVRSPGLRRSLDPRRRTLHPRTRRLLTGATLTLLAVACAGALGASKAAAASQQTTATVHKITACGYTATAAGTYELTKNLTDAGSGSCIALTGSKITLYLDSHTITGTGTDTCVAVASGGPAEIVNDTVVGGAKPEPAKKGKKAKPAKPATLTNCETGLVVARTSGTMANNLKIVAPTHTGVASSIDAGIKLTQINVPMQGQTTSVGFEVVGGADNVVTKSTVDTNGIAEAFVAVNEVGDSFTYDSVTNTYSTGSTGTGFLDASSSRNTYSHDSSKGQFSGFVFAEGGDGAVTATHNSATGQSANVNSYGFEVIQAYQQNDFASPFHTLISHNKATGFQYGFFDHSAQLYAVAEKWTNNTADNYSLYGFYIDYPTDYTMTGNIADANTAGKTYAGGSTCGFCLANASTLYPFAAFAHNQAYDSQYGFDSGGSFVGGKGNVAKRNKYNANNVEITG